MSVAQEKSNDKKSGYAPVNGLKMYYEIEGSGKTLVYIPPAFGYAGVNSFPALIKNHRMITPDLQGHGRTADIVDRPISFEQHAKDVVALLKHLDIQKADFFGESFGGLIATMIAIRHPELVSRVATYGSIFSKPQDAVKQEVLATQLSVTPDAKGIQFQRENYRNVAPDPDYWPTIWSKVLQAQFTGFSREELASLKTPFFIAVGDHDFVRLEHSVETFQIIPNAELAVIPDAGHFVLDADQQKVMPAIETFFEGRRRRSHLRQQRPAITQEKQGNYCNQLNSSAPVARMRLAGPSESRHTCHSYHFDIRH
ncbi:MAG TPA: alpha/beta hydrolase [Bryobacteraceae bacterium]|nr:alpha/beta hydrolase [Bryobacteraceae bacterium]